MCSQIVKSAPKLSTLTKMAKAGLNIWHELRQTHRRIIGQSESVWNRSTRARLHALDYDCKSILIIQICQKPACFGSDQH